MQKYLTGGRPCPAEYTDNDLFILQTMGETPVFKGIKDNSYDTPIEVTATKGVNDADARACGTMLRSETLSLVTALNSGKFLF